MFGQRLFNARKTKNLTLEQLAQIYNDKFDGGLSKGTLSKYENGKQEPMISTVGNLASILGVSVDYLINDENEAELMGFDVPMERNNKTREPFGAFLQKKLKESNLSIEQLDRKSVV